MLFSTPSFFIFFGFYLFFQVLIPDRYRLLLIIVGSSIFYAYWNPYYIWLPYVSIFLAFRGALWMIDVDDIDKRKTRLKVVIGLLLIPLLLIKYTNFIYRELFWYGNTTTDLVDWQLPLGISFITFTLIAYVVDVYKGIFKVEHNSNMLAGLVLFFPHLIAGPILRPSELLPQLNRQRRYKIINLYIGIAIFSIGLFKKLVFADTLSSSVDAIYQGSAVGLTKYDYLLGVYAFAVQIYCDFSGYTDMAIGSAIVLGVKLPRNFERPYSSTSIIDFWKRWHISLSKWLRDYLYIPLGGNKNGFLRQTIYVFITMTLGGLWHGASWTFVLWGIFHAIGIIFVHTINNYKILSNLCNISRSLKIFLTFHFVVASWILFRSWDIQTFMRITTSIYNLPFGDFKLFLNMNIFPILLIIIFFLTHKWDTHSFIRHATIRMHKPVFFSIIVIIWVLSISISEGSSANFIYFDF